MSGALGFIYIDSYLGIGDRFTELFLPSSFIGPAMIPVWAVLLRRFEKYRVTAAAFSVYALAIPLPWFVSPGPGAFLPMLAITCAMTVFYPLLMIAMPTMLGDAIDVDELATGKNRAGQYNALFVLVAKANVAVGGPLALLFAGLFGYQPGAENSAEAVDGLRLASNVLPLLLVAPGAALLWVFPMTDAKHRAVRDALERRRPPDGTPPAPP